MRAGVTGLLAAIVTVFALFALTGYQVTTETAGTRLLGRLGAAMIEIDRWVPAHQEDLDLLGRDQPTDLVAIRDLPVAISVSSAQLIGSDVEELTTLLRDEMGRALYQDGTGAFQKGDGETASLSVGEPVRWTTTLLNSGMHGFWQAALLVTGVLLIILALAMLSSGHLPLASIAVGAGVAAVLSLIFWLLAQVLSSSFESPIDKEIALMLRDGAWIGVRNSAAVAIAAAIVGFLLSRHFEEQRSTGFQLPAHDPDSSPF